MDISTAYGVLQLKPPVSVDEVKKQYHNLALRFHPDKNPQQQDRFQEIHMAFEVVKEAPPIPKVDSYGKRDDRDRAQRKREAEERINAEERVKAEEREKQRQKEEERLKAELQKMEEETRKIEQETNDLKKMREEQATKEQEANQQREAQRAIHEATKRELQEKGERERRERKEKARREEERREKEAKEKEERERRERERREREWRMKGGNFMGLPHGPPIDPYPGVPFSYGDGSYCPGRPYDSRSRCLNGPNCCYLVHDHPPPARYYNH